MIHYDNHNKNTAESASKRMLKSARAYAERFGWAVLPLHSVKDGRCTCGKPSCHSAGKHPRTRQGLKDATKDTATIEKWWTWWPDANIGIATGAASGFWVLDIDGDAGKQSLEDLEQENGALPDTVEAITGSGGRHILFRHESGMKNSVRKLGDGLDIRADGGYIVAAPSIHSSGGRYEWEASSRPNEVAIQKAPGWLSKAVKGGAGASPSGKPKAHPPEYWAAVGRGVDDGARNVTTTSLAGLLLQKNLPPELAYQLLSAWNKQYNRPPDDESVIRTTFLSILKKDTESRNEVIRHDR